MLHEASILKILHVVPTYLPATRYGGPIRSVHGLCKGLASRDHDVEVFTTNVDGSSESNVPLNNPVDLDGVKVFYFRSPFLRRLYWSPDMGRALSRRIPEFDIVHVHSVFLWPTWAAARTARKFGIPYFLAPRGMLVRDLILRRSRVLKTIWIRFFERKNLECAAAVHLTTHMEYENLLPFDFRLPVVYEIPNGLDFVAEANPSMPQVNSVNGPFVLFLGRVNWEKGLDRLIKAWRDVPDMRLLIVGNDEENYTEQLITLAEECGVRDRIKFIGPMHGEEKRNLYHSAQLMVLPSYSENFGIVVLEALAAGCPVVVTEEVGAKDIVIESGGGLVTSGGPKMLAAAVNKLLSDPARKARGEKAAEYVRDRYSWDAIAEQMELAYTEILAKAGNA